MIDFVTIVFHRDLDIWLLQARSFANYCDPACVSSINIIINEQSKAAEKSTIHRIKKNLFEFRSLQKKVKLWTSGKILRQKSTKLASIINQLSFMKKREFSAAEKGWNTQQVLKLLCYSICARENIVLLDAKNHFVAQVSYKDFFSTDGKPNAVMTIKAPKHSQHRWLLDSLAVFKVPKHWASKPTPPTTTPYPVTRTMLSGLCKALEAEYGSVENFFKNKKSRATEFFLIAAHTVSLHQTLNEKFNTIQRPRSVIFRKSPHKSTELNIFIDRAEKGESPIFGIHAARKNRFSASHYAKIMRLWHNKKLASPSETARILGLIALPESTYQADDKTKKKDSIS